MVKNYYSQQNSYKSSYKKYQECIISTLEGTCMCSQFSNSFITIIHSKTTEFFPPAAAKTAAS